MPCLFAERVDFASLVALLPVGDLLLRAKHLFVVARQDDDMAGVQLDPFADLPAEPGHRLISIATV